MPFPEFQLFDVPRDEVPALVLPHRVIHAEDIETGKPHVGYLRFHCRTCCNYERTIRESLERQMTRNLARGNRLETDPIRSPAIQNLFRVHGRKFPHFARATDPERNALGHGYGACAPRLAQYAVKLIPPPVAIVPATTM